MLCQNSFATRCLFERWTDVKTFRLCTVGTQSSVEHQAAVQNGRWAVSFPQFKHFHKVSGSIVTLGKGQASKNPKNTNRCNKSALISSRNCEQSRLWGQTPVLTHSCTYFLQCRPVLTAAELNSGIPVAANSSVTRHSRARQPTLSPRALPAPRCGGKGKHSQARLQQRRQLEPRSEHFAEDGTPPMPESREHPVLVAKRGLGPAVREVGIIAGARGTQSPPAASSALVVLALDRAQRTPQELQVSGGVVIEHVIVAQIAEHVQLVHLQRHGVAALLKVLQRVLLDVPATRHVRAAEARPHRLRGVAVHAMPFLRIEDGVILGQAQTSHESVYQIHIKMGDHYHHPTRDRNQSRGATHILNTFNSSSRAVSSPYRLHHNLWGAIQQLPDQAPATACMGRSTSPVCYGQQITKLKNVHAVCCREVAI
ncbi:hypothetical protein EK904_001657 [Melospiza melodia maxima]|nr:hypothetical protein EK904_001657 [Melospiza melodia maxima]